MPDTFEKIEEYLESLEDYFFSSLSAATQDLPNIHEAVNRLWLDISRYGPQMPSFPDIQMPVLGDLQVPPPPPTPPSPPHLAWISRSSVWVKRHPWTVSGIAVGVVGATLLVGYHRTQSRVNGHYKVRAQNTERRQVVVVLGGDTPFGLPLILELESKGYIVIASVATPEAAHELEHKCNGYVRALVLDPQEPATVPVFLRSLTSTLSRKFPITSSGDPFASPSSHPYIQSVICLLTLCAANPPVHAPLEHLSLGNTYLPYLNATQITPLQTIQALLPLLRTGAARSRDKGKKTIVFCLPAIETRVGLPFTGIQSMSAASTLRAIEVLRREINLASLTDKTESMKSIRVVVADVGAVAVGGLGSSTPEDVYKAMENWTPSEKLTYGPSFASVLQNSQASEVHRSSILPSFLHDVQGRLGRKPTDINVFVRQLVSVVVNGRNNSRVFGIGLTPSQIRNWLRGERFSIGAGANTYKIASNLPTIVLDTLLNIPYFLISLRNRLLPAQPFVLPPAETMPAPVAPTPQRPATRPEVLAIEHTSSTEGKAYDASETSSEADTDGELSSSVPDGSWVRLHPAQEQESA